MLGFSPCMKRLVVSGGAERRRRTTRRYFEKVRKGVGVRGISEYLEWISVEIFVNIVSTTNVPQCQFTGHRLTWKSLQKILI